MVPDPKNDDIVVVRYKFKNDDKFSVKTVTMDVYEEMKNSTTNNRSYQIKYYIFFLIFCKLLIQQFSLDLMILA